MITKHSTTAAYQSLQSMIGTNFGMRQSLDLSLSKQQSSWTFPIASWSTICTTVGSTTKSSASEFDRKDSLPQWSVVGSIPSQVVSNDRKMVPIACLPGTFCGPGGVKSPNNSKALQCCFSSIPQSMMGQMWRIHLRLSKQQSSSCFLGDIDWKYFSKQAWQDGRKTCRNYSNCFSFSCLSQEIRQLQSKDVAKRPLPEFRTSQVSFITVV